jgi:hypothetical protein
MRTAGAKNTGAKSGVDRECHLPHSPHTGVDAALIRGRVSADVIDPVVNAHHMIEMTDEIEAAPTKRAP